MSEAALNLGLETSWAAGGASTIVFIEARLPRRAALLQALYPSWSAALLDPLRDGLMQIQQALGHQAGVLRQIGLSVASGADPLSPEQWLADGTAVANSPYYITEVDGNRCGKVKNADALAIVRMAVKLSAALPQEWLFVEETHWGGAP